MVSRKIEFQSNKIYDVFWLPNAIVDLGNGELPKMSHWLYLPFPVSCPFRFAAPFSAPCHPSGVEKWPILFLGNCRSSVIVLMLMSKFTLQDYRKEHCVTNLIGNIVGTAPIFWLKPSARRAGLAGHVPANNKIRYKLFYRSRYSWPMSTVRLSGLRSG